MISCGQLIVGGFDGPPARTRYLEALRHVVAAAREAGKEAGILLRRLDDLERHVHLGFRFIGVGSDSAWLADGGTAAAKAAAALRSRLAG